MDTKIQLTLYIAGRDAAAEQIIDRLTALCNTLSPLEYELAIVDLLQEPHKAQQFKILSIPTLIKSSPKPEQRFIGDLSNLDELPDIGIYRPSGS